MDYIGWELSSMLELLSSLLAIGWVWLSIDHTVSDTLSKLLAYSQ